AVESAVAVISGGSPPKSDAVGGNSGSKYGEICDRSRRRKIGRQPEKCRGLGDICIGRVTCCIKSADAVVISCVGRQSDVGERYRARRGHHELCEVGAICGTLQLEALLVVPVIS